MIDLDAEFELACSKPHDRARSMPLDPDRDGEQHGARRTNVDVPLGAFADRAIGLTAPPLPVAPRRLPRGTVLAPQSNTRLMHVTTFLPDELWEQIREIPAVPSCSQDGSKNCAWPRCWPPGETARPVLFVATTWLRP